MIETSTMNKLTAPFLFSACVLALCVSGCGVNPLVTLGLKDPPPIVTNSEYFNTQLDTLLRRLKENKLRSIKKAAILDFINSDGKVSAMGKYLTGKFGERAVAGSFFKIAPQGQVDEALKKFKIIKTGELTKIEAEQLGKELGADAVVTGVVSDLQKGSDVDLSVKAVQAVTGDLMSAASVNIHRSKQVQTLLQQF